MTRTRSKSPSTRQKSPLDGATIIFVGPTLPAGEVSTSLPDAIVVGPVAVGEVLALVRGRHRPARIAIIDGYFERMAAVWHKELLLAMEAGIEVSGAASMGALRGAELAAFGMIAVGSIARDFQRGTLIADDEVAVAHLPAEYGYRSTSDALVNLRHGLAKAPMLSATTRDRLIELARVPFYRDRSWARLIADGRAARLPARQLDALAAWPKPDLKAADARLLLKHLARTKPTRPAKIEVPRTWALAQLEALHVAASPKPRRAQSASASRSKIPDHRK